MFFKDKKEYEEYLEKNEVAENIDGKENYFNWTEDGYIKLEKNKFLKSYRDVSRYTNCMGWRILSDKKTMVLIKRPFGEIYRTLSKENYDKSIYNNIVMPQIAKQFRIESAIYYLAKKDKPKNKSEGQQKYIVTKDFREQDEELIHGEEMLEENNQDTNELNIENLIHNIILYIENKGYINSDKEQIRKEFIKQSFFNRFVKQVDENNHNWGLLVNEFDRRARISPIYDLDCCCEMGKAGKYMRTTNNGSTIVLDDFIRQYAGEEWFKDYIEEILGKLDIEKALLDSKNKTNFEIPEEYKEKYRDFFAYRKRELQDAFERICKGEPDKKEEFKQR